MSNAILSLIGLCKKAGRLEVGEEPVGAAARARHARLLLVASDAAASTRRVRIAALAASAGSSVYFTVCSMGHCPVPARLSITSVRLQKV